jgi:hypothetical protein
VNCNYAITGTRAWLRASDGSYSDLSPIGVASGINNAGTVIGLNGSLPLIRQANGTLIQEVCLYRFQQEQLIPF